MTWPRVPWRELNAHAYRKLSACRRQGVIGDIDQEVVWAVIKQNWMHVHFARAVIAASSVKNRT